MSGLASVGRAVEPKPPSPAPGRARPKSSSFAPLFVSITLPGLRSRWTMPCRCAASSASAICAPNRTTWSSGSGPFAGGRRATRRRAAPSPGSRVSSWPTSKSVQMCGWLSGEIVFASRSKRSRALVSAKPAGRTLTATLRSRRVSRARQTSPIPPAPIGADLVGSQPRSGLDGHSGRSRWPAERHKRCARRRASAAAAGTSTARSCLPVMRARSSG